jgi:deoxyribose-phosphate aldolase
MDASQLAGYIDHTILSPTTSRAQVEQCCAEAASYGFKTVCIPPPFVALAAQILAGLPTGVTTVIGFPFGYAPIESKLAEAVLTMVDGADELDMVINLIALKEQQFSYLEKEIATISAATQQKGKTLKLILETGLLTEAEIVKCCQLYSSFPVQFLKTSTGYAATGATTEAVQLLRANLPSHILVKASGGIRDYSTAVSMINAGADRLGCSASVQIVQHSPKDHPTNGHGY